MKIKGCQLYILVNKYPSIVHQGGSCPPSPDPPPYAHAVKPIPTVWSKSFGQLYKYTNFYN